MLLFLNPFRLYFRSFTQLRKLDFFCIHRPNRLKPFKLRLDSIYAKEIFPGRKIYRCRQKNSRSHLRGNRAAPNEVIETKLVICKIIVYGLRSKRNRSGTNRFMRILCFVVSPIKDALGCIFFTVIFDDILFCLFHKTICQSGRIGTHIRY